MPRLLLGPASGPRPAGAFPTPEQGGPLFFGPGPGVDVSIRPDDTWSSIAGGFPPGWEAEAVALFLDVNFPGALWTAPVPVVGMVRDWGRSFHRLRLLAPFCDCVATTPEREGLCRRLGLRHVQATDLSSTLFAPAIPSPENTPRDVDLLVVSRPAARLRCPWPLEALLPLADAWRVSLHTGPDVPPPERLARARVVLIHPGDEDASAIVRSAALCGALALADPSDLDSCPALREQFGLPEWGTRDVIEYLTRCLEEEPARAARVAACLTRISGSDPVDAWRGLLGAVEASLSSAPAGATRPAWTDPAVLLARVWHAQSGRKGDDPFLVRDLASALIEAPRSADLHNALGVLALGQPEGLGQAVASFRRAVACDPDHLVAAFNLAEALRRSGQDTQAAEQANHVLMLLRRLGPLHVGVLDSPPCFAFPDLFHGEWERAALLNAGRPDTEAKAKRDLMAWRLHALLGQQANDNAHRYEAVIARPDLPSSRAALGSALAAAGRLPDGIAHLRQALAAEPFDAEAARNLFQAFQGAGEAGEARRLARDRRALARLAPDRVPSESWFVDALPVGDELASVIVPCCGALEYTRNCLESVLRHTRSPYELILVDNASDESTAAYLEGVRSARGPERVVVIRNDTNLGFTAACNQGFAQARGRYLAVLHNDTAVPAGWLAELIALSLCDWPRIGLVGPVSNGVPPPQHAPADYRSPGEFDLFAAARKEERKGQAIEVGRLDSCCLLIRREVLDRVGTFDPAFADGFFAEDDFCLRAADAGFRRFVALSVFVHHSGGVTFSRLGVPTHPRLRAAFETFRARWGPARTSGYHPPLEPPAPAAPAATVVTMPEPAPSVVVAEEPTLHVSLCMIVKNEEEHLATCLRSVADLVSEIVVVDTGSHDRTKQIAQEAGARVFDFAWVDSFAAARNESLRHARGRWILWLDADEFLDEENRQRLRSLLASLPDANVGYLMRQLSRLEGGPDAATYVDQLRLFRNDSRIRWDYRVHEQILPAVRRSGGDVAETDIVITHCGFIDPRTQGAKVDRNLRLLELEQRERPDDPFVLYNLGAVAMTQGRLEEAVDFLERSIRHSHPGDSLVRKLYALLARTLHQLGRREQALATCRKGQVVVPDDAELLFWEGILLKELGKPAEAEDRFTRLLGTRPTRHLTSVDAGLYGYRTRQLLAEVLFEQGRTHEAEAQWRRVVAEVPAYRPGWLGLAEIFLQQQRWPELEEATGRLEGEAQAGTDARFLRARGCLARKDFPAARELLAGVIEQLPKSVTPRVLLSYALLQEGKDWAAAEQALRDVLTLDPNNREARHNLDLLLQRRGQARPPVPVPQGSTPAVAVAGAQPRVSLCMIVRNEEANLPACLESVAGLVDEIVIVDTGSTDSTRAVAARYGARVFDFPWVDSFAAARNESLRHARGAWILWLDADDRLDPANRERLRALLAGLGDERAAYVMKCLCLPNHQTGVETVVDHVRLFRNLPGLRWRYRIHEQILPDLRRAGCDIRWSGVVVHHTGYQDPATLARKLQRDERLLLMELAEDPDEPFTQFNLGALRQEQGRLEEAAGHFQKSLDRSRQGDTIHRKLFALLAQCHNRLGRPEPALAACAECLRLYSDDAEALVQEGMARRALKDLAGAAACWERVLASPPADYFQSINAGLRGYTTRHNLAVVYEELGVVRHARSHWEAALAERPDYEPAWRGLAGLYLRQQMWSELERLAASLESQPGGAARAAVLRGRALLARQEFAAARRLLEGVVALHPVDPEPRTVLSHVLLQEGRDWAAAEAALRGLLEIDPEQQEARHNLAVLLRQQGRA